MGFFSLSLFHFSWVSFTIAACHASMLWKKMKILILERWFSVVTASQWVLGWSRAYNLGSLLKRATMCRWKVRGGLKLIQNVGLWYLCWSFDNFYLKHYLFGTVPRNPVCFSITGLSKKKRLSYIVDVFVLTFFVFFEDFLYFEV